MSVCPPDRRGKRESIAQVVLSAPRLTSSQTAEALGLRAALLLTKYKTEHPGRLEVVGNNLSVLRFAATNGKIQTAEIWQPLELPLMHTAIHGWDCEWVAVRRAYNGAADQLATIGTRKAVEAPASQADLRPELVLWEDQSTVDQPLEFPWHEGWLMKRVADPFWVSPGYVG